CGGNAVTPQPGAEVGSFYLMADVNYSRATPPDQVYAGDVQRADGVLLRAAPSAENPLGARIDSVGSPGSTRARRSCRHRSRPASRPVRDPRVEHRHRRVRLRADLAIVPPQQLLHDARHASHPPGQVTRLRRGNRLSGAPRAQTAGTRSGPVSAPPPGRASVVAR